MVLADLQIERLSPIEDCMARLSAILEEPSERGHLKVPYRHYVSDQDPDRACRFMETVQDDCYGILFQLYYRFRFLDCWLFPLTKCYDVRVSADEKDLVYADFLDAKLCCLDDDFGLKVRSRFVDYRSLCRMMWAWFSIKHG